MAELKINLPAPDPSLIKLLVEALAPLMALVTLIDPALVTPKVNPGVLVMPIVLIVKVFVPVVASVLILEAVCTVKPPVKVAAADVPTNLMAPPLLIPVPLILKGSAMVKAVAPLISRAAPLDIIFVDAVAAPNASLFWVLKTPL